MLCSKCDGKGYIVNGKEFIDFCDCELGNKIKKHLFTDLYKKAGILSEYWFKTIDDFIPQLDQPSHFKFVEKTKNVLNNIDKIHNTNFVWFIYGYPGVGKSLAASLILMEAIKKGYSCKYIIWIDLLRGRLNEEIEIKLTNELKTTDFLVIDEISTETFDKNKLILETLDLILKYRYSDQKPTILILKEDFYDIAKKVPIISELGNENNVSKVIGANFRKDTK